MAHSRHAPSPFSKHYELGFDSRRVRAVDAFNPLNGKRKYMKRIADSVLLLLVAITCIFTYKLYQQNSTRIPQSGRQTAIQTRATNTPRASDHRPDRAAGAAYQSTPEPIQKNKAGAPRPVDLAPHGKAKPATLSPSKSTAELETASALDSAGGGGGEVLLTPERGCAPDSYIVQPCSFEDWTYTFPED